MSAVWFRTRVDLRGRWRAWLGLALLIGLFGGIVLAAAAGARRTQTAYPRMVRETRDADVLVGAEHTGLQGFYDEVARLPEVTAVGQWAGVNLVVVDGAGQPDFLGDPTANASVDGRLGYSVFRPNLLSGRLPRPDQANEVLANPAMARVHRLKVGSKVAALTFHQLPDDLRRLDASQGTPVSLSVVGIGVLPPEVVPVSPRDNGPQFTVTPAFFRTYADPEHLPYDAAVVRLRPATDIAGFRDRVEALATSHPEVGQLFFTAQTDRRMAAERAITPQAVALAAFAALAGLTTILVVGQLLARQRLLESADHPVLRSLGMTPGQLVTLGLLRTTSIALAGGLLAVGLAVVASPLFPTGPARLAEPHRGLSMNLTLLGAGLAAIVVILTARVAGPAWRAAVSSAARPDQGRISDARPSRLAEATARLGVPASFSTGLRMAVEPGRGAAAVPVRTTVAGTLVAIATVVAALAFGTSLNHLVATPRLYGQDWDVAYDAGFSTIPTATTTGLLSANRGVEAFAGGVYGDLTVEGKGVAAVGIDLLEGSVYPTLLDGRPAQGDAEIVLGTKVLSRLDRKVGDTVTVASGGEGRPMRIVGRAAFPKLGRGSFSTTSLGDGAAVAGKVLAQPDPAAPADIYNFMLIRWTADPAQKAARTRLLADLSELAAGCSGASGICLPTNQRPGVIDGYARVQRTPVILAALLALLAVATLAHTLVTSIRCRRRDLAILKTIGFVRRQVSAAVAWQATVLATFAVAIGVPLGLAAGRRLWRLFADQLGVAAGPTTSLVAVAAVIPVTLLLANLIAAIPARVAAHTRPAIVLRSE